MSRLGTRPIQIPQGVEVSFKGADVVVSKGKSTLSKPLLKYVKMDLSDNVLRVFPLKEGEKDPMWGTCYSLVGSMIKGVSEGFSTTLEIFGVGYKAEIIDNFLVMSLGYSHDIFLEVPEDIEVKCEKNTVVKFSSMDKRALGAFVSKVIGLRRRDPYKGKGIYKAGEIKRRKKGKNK